MKTSEVLGYTKENSKDWFEESDTEIQELLAKKREVSPPGTPSTALLSREESQLPSILQRPSAQALGDPERLVGAPGPEDSAVCGLRRLLRVLRSFEICVWPHKPSPESLAQLRRSGAPQRLGLHLHPLV